MNALRRKVSLLVTLLAWFFASGGQWDIVQVFAWARMFADNAATMPWGEALARTFSPEGRCDLCGAVSTAKQQQEDTPSNPAAKSAGKLALVFEAAPFVWLAAPAPERWPRRLCAVREAGRERPPVPPPRA